MVVSSLMLGTASAQTDLDDVAPLARALLGWCSAGEAVAAGGPNSTQQQVTPAVTSDHDAQLVLLALALAAAQSDAGEATTMTLAGIQPVFERVVALLGETP